MLNYWNIEINYIDADTSNINNDTLSKGEAVLLIGDKVFKAEGTFDYRYDLGK